MRKLIIFETVCLCWHILSPKALDTEYFILKDSINTCSKSDYKLDMSVLVSTLHTI